MPWNPNASKLQYQNGFRVATFCRQARDLMRDTVDFTASETSDKLRGVTTEPGRAVYFSAKIGLLISNSSGQVMLKMGLKVLGKHSMQA